MYHATRLAASETTERVALEFELAGSQQAKGLSTVPPQEAAAGAPVSAAATAQDYLGTHIHSWQPSTPGPGPLPARFPKLCRP